jgi:hypothetical protein
MNVRQAVRKTALAVALAFLPVCVPAQSFQWVLQEGSVNASAGVFGPTGNDGDGDAEGVPSTGPFSIFTGAGVSFAGMSASATSRMETSLAPHLLTVSGEMDVNGSVGNPEEQSAGGTAGANMRLVFKVDTPALLTMTGSTGGVWSGDSSSDPGFWLESTTAYLVDAIGAGAQVDFQTLLVPTETYSLIVSSIASGGSSPDFSFGSAQGSFNIRLALQVAPVPEPNAACLLAVLSLSGLCGFLRHRKRSSDTN